MWLRGLKAINQQNQSDCRCVDMKNMAAGFLEEFERRIKMEEKRIGYKGFSKGMICRGKKYRVGETYEEEGADSCCKAGMMHFCDTPLDVLDYYPIIDDNCEFNEFAEVEPLDEVFADGNKRATKKLKIVRQMTIEEFIDMSVSIIAKSDDESQLAASGVRSQLAASGNWSRLAASGVRSKLAASGYESQLAASGDASRLAASGNWSQLATSGNWSRLAASGDGSKLAASGYESQLAASGDESQLAASGNWSRLATSGNWSRLAASGDGSLVAMDGINSIGAAIGFNSCVKGKKGNWMVLAEWEKNEKGHYIPVNVKATIIDGETIKEDTWYKLENGEFVETEVY